MSKQKKSNAADISFSKTAKEGDLSARRQAIKLMMATGGVVTAAATSDKWLKPVVNSVVLPAHAQTSVFSPIGNFSSLISSPRGFAKRNRVLDLLVPNAVAQTTEEGISCGPDCGFSLLGTFSETEAALFNDTENFGRGDFGGECFTLTINTPSNGDAPVITDSYFYQSSSGNADSLEFTFNSGRFNQATGNWEIPYEFSRRTGATGAGTVILAPGGEGLPGSCSDG